MIELYAFSNIEDCVDKIASDIGEFIAGALRARKTASFAISGGRTPEYIFPILSKKDLPWDKVSFTLTDERWVDISHKESNEGLARSLLLKGPASKASLVGLKNEWADPYKGQENCETGLMSLNWPLDGIFLGMGEDGHIASLFPIEKFTHEENWLNSNGRVFPVAASGDRRPRMSLTPRAILNCRQIFLVIIGPQKWSTYLNARSPGPIWELPVRIILQQKHTPVGVYACNQTF